MESPLVSIIMPAWNAEKFISHAIESMLNQTLNDFEFIIIDDFSTDGTKKIIKEYQKQDSRIKIISNKSNVKLAKSLNIGIQSAKGKYIARMDADDDSLPERLELQVNYMNAHPEVGIVGGSMNIIDVNGRKIGTREYPLDDQAIRTKLFRFSPFSHPLVMMQKEALTHVGLYDPAWNPAEDYELYFRIGNKYKFGNLKDYLLNYRILSSSMTSTSILKMEKRTLEIRDLYKKSTKYKYTISDKIYRTLEQISTYILPSRIRVRLFMLLRMYNII